MPSEPMSFETLVSYAVGELRGDEAKEAEQRIHSSPELSAQLQRIREVLQAMRADHTHLPRSAIIDRAAELFRRREQLIPTVWLGQAFRAIAELLYDSRRAGAIAGFRGASHGYHLSYKADDARIDLQVTPASPESRLVNLQGQIESDQ